MTTNETPTSRVSDIPEDEPIIPPRQQPTVDTTEFKTVTVGTLTIETLDVEATALEQGPLYPKESRDKMTADKHNDLFKEAVKLSQARYDFTSMTLTDERRLDDLYNMSIMIAKTKASHQQYNMCDVFTVVFPLSEGSRTLEDKFLDLYTQYDEITEEEDATSCEWYNKWTAKEYYRDNLTLTFKHLENNMTHKLFDKCFERYDTYPPIQQGGPLLFIIMMKTLVSSSEEATQHLKDMVKNLKISDFKGENVLRVVSLIRGAYKRLKWIKRVPDRFVDQILAVLQTSSVPTFNEYFEHYSHTFSMLKDMAEMDRREKDVMDIDKLLRIAEKKYNSLVSSGEWSGSRSKGSRSTFTSQVDTAANTAANNMKKPICWNCGEVGHTFYKCPQPKDEKRIESNRNQRNVSANTAQPKPNSTSLGDPPFKWRPPTPSENNKRLIDGKHMFYLHKLKRWILDKRHPANTPATATTSPTTPSTSNTPIEPTTGQANPALEAALANTSRSIEASLRGLVNQFS